MKQGASALAVFFGTLLGLSLPSFAQQEEKQPELFKTLKRADPPDPTLNGVALAPDGKIVAVSSDAGINLYDVDTHKLIRSMAGRESFVFTADSQWILEPGYSGLRAWQVKKP